MQANPEVMCTTVPPAKSNAYDGDKSGSRSSEPPPMYPPPRPNVLLDHKRRFPIRVRILLMR